MKIYGFEQYGDRGVERFLDVPDPQVRDDAVLIRMRAASINPADIKVRSGQRTGRFEVVFPMAMGREAAGEVVADPAGRLAPGTLVLGGCAPGVGALADQVLLDAQQAVVVPAGVSPEDAACIPVAIGTAWDALGELGIGARDTLVVLGAGGGVGIHAVQLARHLGARVIGVASAGKAELVGEYGGEPVASGAEWVPAVRRLAPEGVTAVLDAVGGDVLSQSVALLAGQPRLRSAASPARAAELGGSGISRRRTAAVYAELAQLVAAGDLRPVISETRPFAESPAAVAAVDSGHARGKVVVTA